MVRDSSFVARRVAGELLLVPIRRNASEMEGLFTLNETAAFIWDMLDGTKSLEQLCDGLAGAFDVSPEQAESDIQELLLQLVEIGAVHENASSAAAGV